jgi:NADP-dependent 3-hydroxy acid dehydrogenase YdfG
LFDFVLFLRRYSRLFSLLIQQQYAGSGIGRHVCLLLEKKGFTVFAVGRRLEKLQETKALASKPDLIELIQADICSETDRAKITTRVGQQPLKFLIHNAGLVGPLAPIDKVELVDFQSVMLTNVEVSVEVLFICCVTSHFDCLSRFR